MREPLPNSWVGAASAAPAFADVTRHDQGTGSWSNLRGYPNATMPRLPPSLPGACLPPVLLGASILIRSRPSTLRRPSCLNPAYDPSTPGTRSAHSLRPFPGSAWKSRRQRQIRLRSGATWRYTGGVISSGSTSPASLSVNSMASLSRNGWVRRMAPGSFNDSSGSRYRPRRLIRRSRPHDVGRKSTFSPRRPNPRLGWSHAPINPCDGRSGCHSAHFDRAPWSALRPSEHSTPRFLTGRSPLMMHTPSQCLIERPSQPGQPARRRHHALAGGARVLVATGRAVGTQLELDHLARGTLPTSR